MAVYTSVNLMQLQRAMIFIDGTNLFYRLEGAHLVVEQLAGVINSVSFAIGGRQISRIYLYTIKEHVDRALVRHGPKFFEGVRVVLGDSIPTAGGNVKEKAVDALLVADLIYHAASRNYDYAVLISTDTDFVHAIRRVEDFGCRTCVIAVCAEVPDRLARQSDQHFNVSREQLINTKIAREA
jgi:uncharacterized LabA/DUF88 family protein